MPRMPFNTLCCRPLVQLSHPREVVRQFTPNWFAVTMGTGILSAALPHLGLPGAALLGQTLWLLNLLLFALFFGLYAARWLLYFNEARRIFGHATVSMFIGTIPMGLATLINGLPSHGVALWGEAAMTLALPLWWLDVALALACGVGIPYLMFTRQEHSIDQMTAVWLLPVVAAEVAAASGGLLIPWLAAEQAYAVLVTSYVLWACSVPVALSILVILLLRMAVHKLPHRNMAASSLLALGPLGTGALGLLLLGQAATEVFAAQGLSSVGVVAHGLGIVGGLLLWGLGLWWLLLALLIICRYLREGMPFNLGWWAFTFPLGVYALATLTLGQMLQLAFFSRLGAGLVGLLALLWVLVMAATLRGAWRGELFVSPCIADQVGVPVR
ncbi:MAG: C4-dicarboxylate ABC transporter [Pseudomonadales bacterium]|jgi:C4-dicarboxylate transporter/malic acid transport protein|uniref:SLAC1 family transporter n=1 Tax=Halopseudomonas TaxID=2901189 RepID=UPI000C6A49A2|nr:C4-dicarboxylate ABC transporter [Halopseudomonas aestusnigri]MAK74440.1 C4-dicarboxylate ABC transporter [Pseudomonadales bacterium]MEE2799596.1 C4-dicarboxylate ABC transporter [Pseudomonadota bacterium]HCP02480.1 C4-dicarboxylate ABC transporter [Pseudomonas sp.]MAP75745.1 C4-dicarboxylate ABC transporter [Pseudomonadales bacterium]MAS67232.1 C4-dicarboxylate ABC transporter [Pseudomonadales bacterium]